MIGSLCRTQSSFLWVLHFLSIYEYEALQNTLYWHISWHVTRTCASSSESYVRIPGTLKPRVTRYYKVETYCKTDSFIRVWTEVYHAIFYVNMSILLSFLLILLYAKFNLALDNSAVIHLRWHTSHYNKMYYRYLCLWHRPFSVL